PPADVRHARAHRRPRGDPPRALAIDAQIAVPEPEPRLAAQLLEHAHEGPGLVATPPALLRVLAPGERVEERVEIGRHVQPEMNEIVAGVDHAGELPRRQYAVQPERELRAADAAGQRD